MKCDYCLRRPREEGGNGSCPLYRRGDDSPERAYQRLLRQFPAGCTSFKPGDLRVKAPPADQMELI